MKDRSWVRVLGSEYIKKDGVVSVRIPANGRLPERFVLRIGTTTDDPAEVLWTASEQFENANRGVLHGKLGEIPLFVKAGLRID